jgi:hypothetical protein
LGRLQPTRLNRPCRDGTVGILWDGRGSSALSRSGPSPGFGDAHKSPRSNGHRGSLRARPPVDRDPPL